MRIKTPRQVAFVQALEEACEGSAVRFFNNCEHPDRVLSSINNGLAFHRIVLSGSTSFTWSGTPEGGLYWSYVKQKLQENY